jgi:transcriptional regulator with XRE-family HTH domain
MDIDSKDALEKDNSSSDTPLVVSDDEPPFSQQYLSGLERGKRNPTLVTVYEISQALGVDYLELLKRPEAEN